MCFNSGDNSCLWLILIIIVICCCCGNSGGCQTRSNCGCNDTCSCC